LQFLWPVDGHAKKAADHLCRPQAGIKDASPITSTTAAHSLASYSDSFRDTYMRVPTSRLVPLQFVVQVQEEPPIIFADIIKWDTNTPDILIGSYAARAARDVGLGHRAAILIEEEVKKLIYRARKAIETGSQQPVERPEDGEKIIGKPSKFPKLIKGDQARHLLEKHAAKRKASLASGGGGGATPEPLAGGRTEATTLSPLETPKN
jgi:hypothetical protein